MIGKILSSFDLYFSKAFNYKHEFLLISLEHINTEHNSRLLRQVSVDLNITNTEGDKYSVIGDALYMCLQTNKNQFTIKKIFHGSSKHDINISEHISSVND